MMERMKSLKFAGEHVLMQVSWILNKRVGLLWNYSEFVLAMIVPSWSLDCERRTGRYGRWCAIHSIRKGVDQ
jgi:hypothetical protein